MPPWCLHVTLIDDEKYFHFDPFRRKHFESELKSIDDSVTHDRDGDALFSTSVHWNNNKHQQIKSNNTINSWTVENRMLFRLIQPFGNDEKYIRFIIKTRSSENIRKLNQQNVKVVVCVGGNDVRKCCGAWFSSCFIWKIRPLHNRLQVVLFYCCKRPLNNVTQCYLVVSLGQWTDWSFLREERLKLSSKSPFNNKISKEYWDKNIVWACSETIILQTCWAFLHRSRMFRWLALFLLDTKNTKTKDCVEATNKKISPCTFFPLKTEKWKFLFRLMDVKLFMLADAPLFSLLWIFD